MASYCQPLPRSRCMVWLGAIATATIAARVPRAREFTLSDVGEFEVPSATFLARCPCWRPSTVPTSRPRSLAPVLTKHTTPITASFSPVPPQIKSNAAAQNKSFAFQRFAAALP